VLCWTEGTVEEDLRMSPGVVRVDQESVIGGVMQAVVRRWLEVLLPLYTCCLVAVWLYPEYTPAILTQNMSVSPLPWLAWGVVGAMTGILGLWALIVGFFLLYSPLYLLGKLPNLVGKGGWVDRHEVRFYLASFGMLCLLAALLYGEPALGVAVFAGLAGCGPVCWRLLV
jgi:hypothetical protein